MIDSKLPLDLDVIWHIGIAIVLFVFFILLLLIFTNLQFLL